MDDSQYTSPYIKSEYSGMIRVRNSSTGEMEEKQIKRTVYRNANIDPDLVIPAGTVMGNETTSQEMTNLERMQCGKPPDILDSDENGNHVYDKVELHHLTSTERNRGSKYFNGEDRDGTVVEIQSSVHNKYKKQLHAVNEKDNSFRKVTTETVDENGKPIRQKTKSYDATQYEKFRSQYWVDRASEITQQRLTVGSKQTTNLHKNEEGGIGMAKSWELTPEERKRVLDNEKKVAEKWRNKSSTSSSDEGKGERERERERTRDRGQSR